MDLSIFEICENVLLRIYGLKGIHKWRHTYLEVFKQPSSERDVIYEHSLNNDITTEMSCKLFFH